MRRTAFLLPAALLFMAGARPAVAQSSSDPQPTRSVLHGVYTEAQAARGETVYRESCAACHSTSEFSGPAFLSAWRGTVHGLWSFISTQMPLDSPGLLKPQEYADIVAYFLKLQGMPTGKDELPHEAEALKKIRIEPKPEK